MLNLSRRSLLSSAAVAAATLGLSKPLIFAGPALADDACRTNGWALQIQGRLDRGHSGI